MSNNKPSNSILQEKDATCYTSVQDKTSRPDFLLFNELPYKPIERILKRYSHNKIRALNLLLGFGNVCKAIFCSQSYLAKKLNLSRPTVNILIGELAKDGYISKIYRTNNTCIYYINPWFRDSTVVEQLKGVLKSLCFLPFLLSALMPVVTLTHNINYSLIFKNNGHEGTAHKRRTYEEYYYHMYAAEALPGEGTSLAEGTNAEARLRSKELHPSDLAWWDENLDTKRVPSAKVRYENEFCKNKKEEAMNNPIKASVMEATNVLNLNKVGQILLMKYSDSTIKYATSKYKDSKAKKDRPFEYYCGIANNYSTKNNIEVNQDIVSFLLSTYKLDINTRPTGSIDIIGRFEGEPAKGPEKGKLSTQQQTANHRPAIEQHSDTFRLIQKDELIKARDLLEQLTYNPHPQGYSLPALYAKEVDEAKKLLADGKITLRPFSVWIESIKPDKNDFNMNTLMGKETYQQQMRRWMELHAKLVDGKKVMTFEMGWDIGSRDLADEQPKETLSTRVNDVGSLLGSLFKQGSTSIIKEVLNSPKPNDQQNKKHSPQGNSVIEILKQYAKMPTFEETIPVATPEMIKTMNLEKEPIAPDVDRLEASVDRMSTQEYITSVAQYFDLEEVLD